MFCVACGGSAYKPHCSLFTTEIEQQKSKYFTNEIEYKKSNYSVLYHWKMWMVERELSEQNFVSP